jgi:hypothetical protein
MLQVWRTALVAVKKNKPRKTPKKMEATSISEKLGELPILMMQGL